MLTLTADHRLVEVKEGDQVKHMKGKIEVFKSTTSTVPSWVALGHRRLEKEKPSGADRGSKVEFVVPVDMLRVAGYPDGLIEGLEEIVLEYQKRP